MERYAEGFETVFFRQAKFAETEEVLVEVFSEVAADELFAAVVEGASAVCACMVAKCRPLEGVSKNSLVMHIAMLTNKSARCDFILSCTTPSFVPNLSTSSLTCVSRDSRSKPCSCNECNTCSSNVKCD